MKKQKHTLYTFIIHFVRMQRGMFGWALLASLVWALDQTLFPYVTQQIVDVLTQHEQNRGLMWNAIFFPLVLGTGLWVLVELGFRLQGFLLARALPQFEGDIRMAMFDHVQHHSPKYFQDRFAGSLSNHIHDMVTHASQLVQQTITIFIPVLLACVLALAFFISIQPFFALLLGVWMGVHCGVCLYFSRRINQDEAQHGMLRTTLMGHVVDSFNNAFSVNLFYRFRDEKRSLWIKQQKEQMANQKAKKSVEVMQAYLGIISFIGPGIAMTALMLTNWADGEMTTGEAVQIFSTSWNMIMLAWIAGCSLPMMFQSMGLAKQALQLIHEPQDLGDQPNARTLNVPRGEIRFENVSFGYGETALFEGKSLVIHPGEKVGLVGTSGAGKSTFINLLLRFHQVQKGRILIDGQNIDDVTLESLRRNVALIPQEPHLFHRSIFENIRYGRLDATAEEIHDAAKRASCLACIERLPKGYATLVGERGAKLSGGERQRIAIARAILSNAPILLLDEATSALDSITEKEIQDALDSLMQGRTTLVIAHRLSTLASMDRILVFSKGKIVESGPHEELIARNGVYTKLWKMQAGGFLQDELMSG